MDKTTIFIAISSVFAIVFMEFYPVLFIPWVAFFQDMIPASHFANLLALMADLAAGLLTAKEA